MNDKRREELIKYISLLQSLLQDGFKCESELQMAIRELHQGMFPSSKDSQNVILVMEDNVGKFHRTVDLYERIFGFNSKSARGNSSKNYLFSNDHSIVKVMLVSSEEDMDRIRGARFHQVVNNTTEPSLSRFVTIVDKK